MDKPAKKLHIKRVSFFYRPYNARAKVWQTKIERWLKTNHPNVKVVDKDFDVLLVLGGDGSMLEAARLCIKNNSLLVGLNLGTVGFLSSVRKSKDFFKALKDLFSGSYYVTDRSMLKAEVWHGKNKVFSSEALNEAAIINPLGMVELDVMVDDRAVHKIRGTGAMVASATGSTAYNLSAHGPVVMPEAKNLVLTEILAYGIPNPSLVLNPDQVVKFTIRQFRKRGLLQVTQSKEIADVLFVVDGELLHPLKISEKVIIRRSTKSVRLVEFEPTYFLKSLQSKY